MIKLEMILFVTMGILVMTFTLPLQVSHAQGSSASEVIQAINRRRRERGLPPLETHPILMSIAQQHSNYQASIGHGTHIGPGGSHPKDRAIAAGFGGGATVFISENWAAVLNLTIQEAINNYWDDYWHRHTMYNENAKYIGVGVARSGNKVYYTVDTGYWVGSPASQDSTPLPTPLPQAAPVQTTTPKEDGSLIHIVQPGQTLWTIAAVYEIPLEKLRELNSFSPHHLLHPGDKVLIQPPSEISSSPTVAATPTPPKNSSPQATGSKGTRPTERELSPTAPERTETPPPPTQFKKTTKNPLIIVIAVIIAAGSILFSIGRGIFLTK